MVSVLTSKDEQDASWQLVVARGEGKALVCGLYEGQQGVESEAPWRLALCQGGALERGMPTALGVTLLRVADGSMLRLRVGSAEDLLLQRSP